MRSLSRPLPPRMRHRLDFVLLKRDTGYSFNWRLDRETDRNSVVRRWGMKAICLRARGGPEARGVGHEGDQATIPQPNKQ